MQSNASDNRFKISEADHQPNSERKDLKDPCPVCGAKTFRYEGCKRCLNCDWSMCG